MRKGLEFQYASQTTAKEKRHWPLEVLFPTVVIAIAYFVSRFF